MGVDRLFLDYKSGSQPTVQQYVLGTPTQLGSAFGTTAPPTLTAEYFSGRDKVIQFQGEVYAVLFDGVYRYNQGPGAFPSGALAGTWSNSAADGALPFADTLVSDDRLYVSGLYSVVVNGVPHLCGVKRHSNATSDWEGFKLNGSTGVWSETGTIAAGISASGPGGGGVHNAFVYRNILHFATASSAGVQVFATYDPSTDAFSTIAATGATITTQLFFTDYAVLDDRLFMVQEEDGANLYALYEFAAGQWQFQATLLAAATGVGREHRSAFFSDGTNMYLICQGAVTLGQWQVIQITSALAVSDISGTVLAGTGLNAVQANAEGRMFALSDVDTAPLSQAVRLYHTADSNSGTTFTVYDWNGPGSAITSADVGGNVFHAVPSDDRQGGDRFFTVGELDVIITDVSPVIGGEQITFRAYNDAGLADKTVKLYFTPDGDPANLVEAQLAAPVTGGSATLNLGSNQVEDVLADGVTDYTVVWDIDGQAPAVSSGDRVMRYIRVSV